MTYSSWSQCTVGPDDYVTYVQTINGSYNTTGTVSGSSSGGGTWTVNLSVSEGGIIIIQSGTASGTITGAGLICIADGAALENMSGLFTGTIRNYSSVHSNITWENFMGSVENYGGVMVFNNVSELENGSHIVNYDDGSIVWKNQLEIQNVNIYNDGYLNFEGGLKKISNGCMHNVGWMTNNTSVNRLTIYNDGIIEVLNGNDFMYDNVSGTFVNNCVLSTAVLDNSITFKGNVNNSGLIYGPYSSMYNNAVNHYIDDGAIVVKNFLNQKNFSGNGRVYVYNNSSNTDSFGDASSTISFWDSTSTNGVFDSNTGTITGVSYNELPTPEETVNLVINQYGCTSKVIEGVELNPGVISSDNIYCTNQAPYTIESIEAGSCPDVYGEIVMYQWQYSENENGPFSDIVGVNSEEYELSERPETDTYYRRMAHFMMETEYSNVVIVMSSANSFPNFVSQPDSMTTCYGDTISFYSEVDNAEIYIWQIQDSESNWIDLENSNIYSGVSTDSLVVKTSLLPLNEESYRLKVSNICGDVYSDIATLYVISNPEVAVEASVPDKCPDTDPALEFNSVDSNYQMGNSAISFIVTRNTTGPFQWGFSYNLVLSNSGLLVDSQPNGNVEITDVDADTHTLMFYIANQTEDIISATLSIDDVEVEGCAESSVGNPNHSATIQVYRMPVIGEFDKN